MVESVKNEVNNFVDDVNNEIKKIDKKQTEQEPTEAEKVSQQAHVLQAPAEETIIVEEAVVEPIDEVLEQIIEEQNSEDELIEEPVD